jgi:hypothetical protein
VDKKGAGFLAHVLRAGEMFGATALLAPNTQTLTQTQTTTSEGDGSGGSDGNGGSGSGDLVDVAAAAVPKRTSTMLCPEASELVCIDQVRSATLFCAV